MSVDTSLTQNNIFSVYDLPTMTDSEYKKLAGLIQSYSGIYLKDAKQALLANRLSGVLAQEGYKDFSDYYNKLIADKSGSAIAELVEKITTNHTFFMREAAHFDYFRQVVLPYLEKTVTSKDLRIWCAACSTGEEAYTLAMILDEYFANNKLLWDSKVLATDLSMKVLRDASKGVYTKDRIDPLPPLWKQKYFAPYGNDLCEVSPRLKNEVIFRRFNLIEKVYPFKKKFHCIFCRNVMIYFDNETKDNIINKLYDATEPGGYLFIGHSEALDREKTKYKYVMPAVYRKI